MESFKRNLQSLLCNRKVCILNAHNDDDEGNGYREGRWKKAAIAYAHNWPFGNTHFHASDQLVFWSAEREYCTLTLLRFDGVILSFYFA